MNTSIPEYIIESRLRAYPPQLLKLGYYLEKKPEMLWIYEFQKRFFQYLDLNYYFFANHPNARVGVMESEKFHYMFLPIFIYGLYKLFRSKNYMHFLLLIIIILYLSLFYDEVSNPILIYPFIIYAIYKGVFTK